MRAMSEEQQKVTWQTVDAEYAGQRIDNFLLARLKGVPKSLVYRILRKGEVRVNKKRAKPDYKLQAGDLVRIPPVRVTTATPLPSAKLDSVQQLEAQVLYEDDVLLVLNKPAGMAVHGGSGLQFGLIESLRALRPNATSGTGASAGPRNQWLYFDFQAALGITRLTRTAARKENGQTVLCFGAWSVAAACEHGCCALIKEHAEVGRTGSAG